MDAKSLIYQFDDVSVYLERFEVLKAETRVRLEPKAFEALVFLIENRGRLVEKKELLDAVWKDAFVGENAMTRVIAQLRKALGDDSKESKYIETVPTRGYRFIPEVEVNERTQSGDAQRGSSLPSTLNRSSGPLGTQGGSTQETSGAEHLISLIKRNRTGRAVVAAGLIIALSVLIYFISKTGSSDALGKAIDSVAVLPFANVGADPDTEYLSDGISESLINSLSQLPRLRVIARDSAFRYKGLGRSVQSIGQELNVQAVLTVRVVQRGDNLSISVELVDVRNNSSLWGEQYDRKLSDLLTIKQEIAREITDKLRLRLSMEEQRQLAKRETGNTEAYQSYLKGRYHWNKRTLEGINKAIEQFQHAVDEDPIYALAYAGLADSYQLLETYAGTSASETYHKAKAYAERALQLDEKLAEAHTSLGSINDRLWQFGEAEKEFQRAISLNPNYATAHHCYSTHLKILRRLDESMAEIKRAQELDPLSLIISDDVAWTYLLTGNLGAAIEQARTTIDLDPNHPQAHLYLGIAYLRQRRYPEAIAELQKAVDLSGGARVDQGFLGYGYAKAGKRAEALAIAKELEEKYARREASGVPIATVYAGLGDKDQAFAWLEKAFQTRSGVLMFVPADLGLDSLQSDPRYQELLRHIGFPQ